MAFHRSMMGKPASAFLELIASVALFVTCTDPSVPRQSTNRCNQDADCMVGFTCQGGQCATIQPASDAGPDAGPAADAAADAGADADAGLDAGAAADSGAEMDAAVDAGGGGTKTIGQTCDFASDCTSGFCVQTNTLGRVCSESCASDCPVGWGCRVVDVGGGNYAQICFPAGDVYCIRCSTSPTCGSGGDQCTNIGGATYCTQNCATKACQAGYECRDVAVLADAGIDAGTTKQCAPVDGGLCPGCVDGDGDGYGIGAGCLGTDSYDGGTCDDDPTRNSGQAEVCDNRDNNCDGVIDDGVDFQTSATHCGACNRACQTNAGTTSSICLAGDCVPTCANGYFDCDGDTLNGCETNLAIETYCAIACGGNDALCPTGFFCSGGTTCEKKRTTGSSCGGANECATGYCFDSKCCNQDCSGLCRTCTTGTCTYYSDTLDPEGECATEAASTCEKTGLCDGNGACQLYAASVECVAQSCTAGVQSNARTCNGSGTCQTGTQVNCNGYACSGTSCRTSCTNDTHCVSTHQCKSYICKKRVGESCGAASECASGACCGSVCRDTQTDTNNCGSCSTACTNAHGTTSCVSGVCTPVCVGLYRSCDSNVVNGCETSVATTSNCGACGVTCDLANAYDTCSTGSCAISSCYTGYKNCDSITSTGCEQRSSGYTNSSPGESLGTTNADALDSWPLCTNATCGPFAQRTGYQGRYFYAYANEDSNCCAYLSMQFDLTVPSGVDYNLYVYLGSPGGSFYCQYWDGSAWQSGCSTSRGSGLTEKIRVWANDDCGGADNNFTTIVEVRWVSGASCSAWTLDAYSKKCAG